MTKFLKWFQNKRIYLILSVLVLVPLFIAVTGLLDNKVKAAWIDPEWQFRQLISIESHSLAENNVYVTIPVFDASDLNRFQSDCGDLRFTKSTGELLEYFVVDCDATSQINVQFDTLPAGQVNFYMYFGNTNAADGYALSNFSTQATGLGNIVFYSGEEARLKPISYWKFDENTGQTLNDSSGNNTAVLGATSSVSTDDPTWTTGSSCLKDSCLTFDNSNDFVDAGTSSLYTFGNNDFSLYLWINVNQSSVIQRLIEKTGTTTAIGQWSYFIQTDGRIAFVNQNIMVVNSNCYITYGKWTQLGFARSGTRMDFFQDGKLCSSHITTQVNYNSTVSLRIGGNAISGANGSINGLIDEVKIFDRAITEAEISDNYYYDQNITRETGNLVGISTNSDMPSPIIHWKLDEGSGQVINNSISTSYNGTAGLSTAIEAIDPIWNNEDSCRTNGCQNFTGSNYDNIGSIGDIGTSYSVSLWFKTSSVAENNIMIAYRTDNQASGNPVTFQLDHFNTDIRFIVRNLAGTSMTATAVGSLVSGQWHHIIGIRQGNNALIYVDGKLRGSASAAITTIPANKLTIGAYYNDTINALDTINNFIGSIDEIKVYNVALTSDQALMDFNAGSALNVGSTSNTLGASLTGGNGNVPVAEYLFDDNTGTSAKDTSTNSSTGTLNNGTGWMPGRIGSSVSLDGLDDNVTFPSSTPLNIGTSDFTIEAFVKGNNLENTDIILGKSDGGSCSTTYGYLFGVFDSLYPTLYFCSAAGAQAKIQGTQTLSNNQWYHISVVVDRDNTSNTKVYIDGIPVTTTVDNLAAHTGSITNAVNLAVGSESDGGFNWSGQIDQVRIYNYVRNQTQVMYNFNKGEPIGWLKFDQTSGTTEYDSSHLTSNGTLVNMDSGSDWITDGTCPINNCLDFDGTNDYVSKLPMPYLTTNFTFSSWVYRTSSTGVFQTIYSSGTQTNAWKVAINTTNKLTFTEVGISDYSSTVDVPAGQWVHIAVVKNGDGANNVTMYINGNIAGTASAGSVTAPSGTAYIGMKNNSTEYFIGRIDDVRIYNYPLSAVQVQQLHNKGAALLYE